MNWTCLAIKWRNVFSWLPVRMQTDGTKSKFEGKARTAFTNQCQLRPMLFLWEDGNKLKSISLNGLRCHIRYFKIKVKCRIVEYQSISVHFLHNLIVYLRKLKLCCMKLISTIHYSFEIIKFTLDNNTSIHIIRIFWHEKNVS